MRIFVPRKPRGYWGETFFFFNMLWIWNNAIVSWLLSIRIRKGIRRIWAVFSERLQLTELLERPRKSCQNTAEPWEWVNTRTMPSVKDSKGSKKSAGGASQEHSGGSKADRNRRSSLKGSTGTSLFVHPLTGETVKERQVRIETNKS